MTEREDIELAFVRMLSTAGLILSGTISAEDRSERIRIVIMQRGLKDLPFDAERSYGEAFERCYRRSVERRRTPRDAHGRPQPAIAVPDRPDPGDDDQGDEGDEGDEDEGVSNRSKTAA
jgi:hypothetical protein